MDKIINPVTEENFLCLGRSIRTNRYPDSSYDYLSNFPEPISIDELWAEMDRVWIDCLLKNNSKYTNNFFAEYYTHPVWCLNSIFSSVDQASIQHRNALIQAISRLQIPVIADMGGGYGVFVQLLKEKLPEVSTILCEPYLDEKIELQLKKKNIITRREIPRNADGYVFLDVLEHIQNPINYLHQIIISSKANSYFIFGNCFHPVIKCHLPSTFYLRRTFRVAALLLGLTKVSNVKGAEYIQIYKRTSSCSMSPKIVVGITKILCFIIAPFSLTLAIARKIKRITKIIVR